MIGWALVSPWLLRSRHALRFHVPTESSRGPTPRQANGSAGTASKTRRLRGCLAREVRVWGVRT